MDMFTPEKADRSVFGISYHVYSYQSQSGCWIYHVELEGISIHHVVHMEIYLDTSYIYIGYTP